jgi:hypothetical protein
MLGERATELTNSSPPRAKPVTFARILTRTGSDLGTPERRVVQFFLCGLSASRRTSACARSTSTRHRRRESRRALSSDRVPHLAFTAARSFSNDRIPSTASRSRAPVFDSSFKRSASARLHSLSTPAAASSYFASIQLSAILSNAFTRSLVSSAVRATRSRSRRASAPRPSLP